MEIMSPSYSALRDGNQPTVPEEYLPRASAAKGFKILPVEPVKATPAVTLPPKDRGEAV